MSGVSRTHRESASTSGLAILVVALALIVGAYLRCSDLGGREMSADEGASWAAASAPTVREVLRAQNHLNPGKAGLHDLALHLWMRAFGERLAVMRALSAVVGSITILLVFGASREIFAVGHKINDAANSTVNKRDEVAALAALIFAVNLITIKYSREVRMYPFVIAAVAAQTWCLFRALRCGGIVAYAGVAVFTAMALAAHLTAVLAFGGEGIWIAYLMARNRFDFSAEEVRRALMLAFGLCAGAVILAPLAPAVIGSAARAANTGAIDWIKRPEVWAPLALFNKATGTFAFPAMAALVAWGILRGWHRWRDGIIFALLWMWIPPLLLLLISYAIRPAFVERYLLSCFVPFFILTAVGIIELPTHTARIGAIVLIVVLSIGHVIAWNRKPHDVQWSEATRAAAANLVNGGTMAVAPGFAVSVVGYYLLENSLAQPAHPANPNGDDPAGVVLIGDQGVAPATVATLDQEYPRMLAHLRGVVVRGR